MNSPSRWEPGMWDPYERDSTKQWWESTGHKTEFMNALRAVLGLAPIPDTEGHRTGGNVYTCKARP
jgi:hypothetical protein